MRISIIANAYPVVSQTFVRDHASALARADNEVAIFCRRVGSSNALTRGDEAAGRIREFSARSSVGHVRSSPVAVSRVLAAGKRSSVGTLTSLGFTGRLGLLTMLGELATRGRIDVVHAHFGNNAELVAAVRAANLSRVALVTVHGMDLRLEPEKARRMWAQHRDIDAVLAHSEWAVGVVHSYGVPREKIVKRHIGVSTSFFRPSRTPDGTQASLSVITVARLEPIKAIDVGIRAVAIATSEGVPIDRYDIIGAGSSRAELELLAAELGLSQVVRFHGAQQPDFIRDRLQEADVFLLTSRAEGLPIAMLEAAACGLPVVVTNVGAVSEGMVPGETGLLVAPDSPHQIAGALSQLLGANTRRLMGGQARHLVVAEFSNEVLNAQWNAFYSSLASDRQR